MANSYIGTGPAEITFAPCLTGVPIDLSLGELFITGSVQIVGLGAKNTVIDAEGNSRVFEVAPSAGNVTLSSLTVTGGETTAASARRRRDSVSVSRRLDVVERRGDRQLGDGRRVAGRRDLHRFGGGHGPQ